MWFLPRQCIPDSFPQQHCPSPAPKAAETNLLIEKRIEKKNELGVGRCHCCLPEQIKNEIPKRNKSALLKELLHSLNKNRDHDQASGV